MKQKRLLLSVTIQCSPVAWTTSRWKMQIFILTTARTKILKDQDQDMATIFKHIENTVSTFHSFDTELNLLLPFSNTLSHKGSNVLHSSNTYSCTNTNELLDTLPCWNPIYSKNIILFLYLKYHHNSYGQSVCNIRQQANVITNALNTQRKVKALQLDGIFLW
jgi:hypothetical protein